MDPAAVVNRRLWTQRLAGGPFASPAAAVETLGAVQAQEFPQAIWALAQRCGHPAADEVIRAFDAGELLRTHVLRPTWHFVRPDDIRWMLRLTAPRIRVAMRQGMRVHDLDDALIARSGGLVAAALEERGPLTRFELREELARSGIEGSAQRIAHISGHLELTELICSGPVRDGKQTYDLLDRRAPAGRGIEGDEALAELAARYFFSHGPASLADFAWWSGLKMGDARRGLELSRDRFEEVGELDGDTYFANPAANAAAPPEGALLLGSFDELTVAYRRLRTVSVNGEPGRTLPLGPILLDGRWVGSWRRIRGKAPAIRASLFRSLDAPGEAGLEAECRRLAAHLGIPAQLELAEGEPLAAA